MRPRKLAHRIALIGGALWGTGLWGTGAQACDYGCGSCSGYGYGYGYGYNAAAYAYDTYDDGYSGYADPEYAYYAYAPPIYSAPANYAYYQPAPLPYYAAPVARPLYYAPLGYGAPYAPYVRGPYWGAYSSAPRTANLGGAKDRAAGAMVRVARPAARFLGPAPLVRPATRIAAPPAGPKHNAPLGYGPSYAPYVRGPHWRGYSNPPQTVNLGGAKDRAAAAMVGAARSVARSVARSLGPAPLVRPATGITAPPAGPQYNAALRYGHAPYVQGAHFAGNATPPRTANLGPAKVNGPGASIDAARSAVRSPAKSPVKSLGATALPPPARSIGPARVRQEVKPAVQMRATATKAPGVFTTKMASYGQATVQPAPARQTEPKAQRNR